MTNAELRPRENWARSCRTVLHRGMTCVLPSGSIITVMVGAVLVGGVGCSMGRSIALGLKNIHN